MEIIES